VLESFIVEDGTCACLRATLRMMAFGYSGAYFHLKLDENSHFTAECNPAFSPLTFRELCCFIVRCCKHAKMFEFIDSSERAARGIARTKISSFLSGRVESRDFSIDRFLRLFARLFKRRQRNPEGKRKRYTRSNPALFPFFLAVFACVSSRHLVLSFCLRAREDKTGYTLVKYYIG